MSVGERSGGVEGFYLGEQNIFFSFPFLFFLFGGAWGWWGGCLAWKVCLQLAVRKSADWRGRASGGRVGGWA